MEYFLYLMMIVNLGTLVANLILFSHLKEQLKQVRLKKVVWGQLATDYEAHEPASIYDYEGRD